MRLDRQAKIPMSSAVETKARWDTRAPSMEWAYAVLELGFKPSERDGVKSVFSY